MGALLSATTNCALALLVVACTHGVDRGSDSGNSAGQSPQPAATAVMKSSPPAFDAGPSGTATQSDSPFAGSGLLASDSNAVRVRGCFRESHEKLSQLHTSRSPIPNRSEVRFSRAHGVLVMTHSFTHACCLDVDVTRANNTPDALVIHERLFGKPCRCMCASDIDVTLPERPEPKSVTVETEWPPENSHTVFSGAPMTK